MEALSFRFVIVPEMLREADFSAAVLVSLHLLSCLWYDCTLMSAVAVLISVSGMICYAICSGVCMARIFRRGVYISILNVIQGEVDPTQVVAIVCSVHVQLEP